ncbi:MAG: hypothetical protein RSE29_23915, partial [Leclercia sp.]
ERQRSRLRRRPEGRAKRVILHVPPMLKNAFMLSVIPAHDLMPLRLSGISKPWHQQMLRTRFWCDFLPHIRYLV